MRILGIETSCDETGIAIYDSQLGLMANTTYSQAHIHAEYGGVVPELASRDHIQKILPVLKETLQQANIGKDSIDGIAYTKGPGLIGALLVGSAFAKSLSYAWNIPAIGVHHMEGHLLAPMLEQDVNKQPAIPFLGLLISGGHTLLIRVSDVGYYQQIGDTVDDAVGEAFDKVAKLLGLGYPGGPLIEQLAQQGDPNIYKFPRPMTDRTTLDFSFSGLKTFALNTYKQSKKTEQDKANIARAFQDAAIDTLCIKCKLALEQNKLKTLVVAGGVGANNALRQAIIDMAATIGTTVYFPRLEFCTDNGAMIAFTGYQYLKKGIKDLDLAVEVIPRWNITDIKY
jgi:N6-L-threonylcarbamoyladenine synthase